MNNLEELESKKCISLETYRKNNESVQTPVWFVIKDDLILCSNTRPNRKSKTS